MGDAYRPSAHRRLMSDEQGVPVFDRSDSRRGSVITEGGELALKPSQRRSHLGPGASTTPSGTEPTMI